MTAQHNQHDDELEPRQAEQPDPIGPITLPKRSKVGRRAMALVGTASVAALGVIQVVDAAGTFTTIKELN
jgi:hypothetical protein